MTTGTPGKRSFSRRTSAPVMDAASEHPARLSGMSTVFSGLSSFEVSAMKCTPQWTMMSASALAASRASSSLSPDVRDAVKNLRRLVVVGEDHRAALGLQAS